MKIICIGRNYAKHAEEMKSELPTEPIFFLKPDTALLKANTFYMPDFTDDLHHEVELVVKINKVGKHISPEFAHKYYNEIGLGIDFTARDVQAICKQKGLPWEKAKAFDNSAVLSTTFFKKDELDLNNINLSLNLNGKTVQDGNSADMIFTIDQIIAYTSRFFTLKIGDLIYTGTPEGVGRVNIGDRLQGHLNGTEMFNLLIK